MRASTADRERTVEVLKSAFAEGRLDVAEYHDRVELTYRAQTYGQLAALIQDLPVGPLPPMLGPVHPAPYAAPSVQQLLRGPRRRTNGLAIASFVCGLGEAFTFGLTSPVALALGLAARGQLRDRPDEEGDGLAVTGIVLGSVGIAIWCFVLCLMLLARG
jgi:hypothetical protein